MNFLFQTVHIISAMNNSANVIRKTSLKNSRFGIWCLTPLSTLFELYRHGRWVFYSYYILLLEYKFWKPYPVQSMPITTKVVSSNPVHGEVEFQVWHMVFNAAFNTIWVISSRSDLLVEETWVPEENIRHTASHWQTLLHLSCWTRTHSISGDRQWLHG
jgi:hypothetical protein